MQTLPHIENQDQQRIRDAISPDVSNMTTAFHVKHQELTELLESITAMRLAQINEIFDRR